MLTAKAGDGRVEQHDAEDDADGLDGNHRRERGTDYRAERGRDFEEHADADVRESLADVGCGGAGGGRDDGYQRGADGIAQIDVEEQRQDRNDDNAAAEAGERAEQAGDDRGAENGESEGDDGHARRFKA